MASEDMVTCSAGMTLEQKLASGMYTHEALYLVNNPGLHTEVGLKSVDEVDEYTKVLKHRILQHAPDANVQIASGLTACSVWVDRPGWQEASAMWVKYPSDDYIDVTGTEPMDAQDPLDEQSTDRISPASPPPDPTDEPDATDDPDCVRARALADAAWKATGEARKFLREFVDARSKHYRDKETGHTLKRILFDQSSGLDVQSVIYMMCGMSVMMEGRHDRIELEPVPPHKFISNEMERTLSAIVVACYYTYQSRGRCGRWVDVYPEKLRFGGENNCWVVKCNAFPNLG